MRRDDNNKREEYIVGYCSELCRKGTYGDEYNNRRERSRGIYRMSKKYIIIA
jgi:hypothetical protein